MSIAVAVSADDRIVLGWDDAESVHDALVPMPPEEGKAFVVGELGVALTGTSLYVRVFHHFLRSFGALDLTSADGVTLLWQRFFAWAKEDAPALDIEKHVSPALLVCPAGAFMVDEIGCASPSLGRPLAVGCAARVALGAMHAESEHTKDPEAVAMAGLRAARDLDAWIGNPVPLWTCLRERG